MLLEDLIHIVIVKCKLITISINMIQCRTDLGMAIQIYLKSRLFTHFMTIGISRNFNTHCRDPWRDGCLL